MFVSESKFLSSPSSFIPHILNPNPSALEGLITKPAVEAALLVRLAKKARWYGAELGPDGEPLPEQDANGKRVDTEEVVRLYREYIIPLTKDVEVRFLSFLVVRSGADLFLPFFSRSSTCSTVLTDSRRTRSTR
jgi:chorismate mutase